MHVITVQFRVHPAKVEAFQAAVTQQAATSLAEEPGCLQFDVAVASDDPTYVFLYELYTDAKAFQVHLQQPHFKRFDETVKPWIVSKKVTAFERIWPAQD